MTGYIKKIYQWKMEKDREDETAFKILDEELTAIYEDLLKNKFTDGQIQEVFSPVLKEYNKQKYIKLFLYIFIFTLIIFTLTTQTVSFYLLGIVRICLREIQPYYDWRYLSNQKCLLPKLWDQKEIQKSYTPNCNLCENVEAIDVLENLNDEELRDFYLDLQKPVILTDDIWSKSNDFPNALLEDEVYMSSYPCKLDTNILEDTKKVGTLLKRQSKFSSFFIQFENCELEGMKRFRRIFKRPKFTPVLISPIQYNWLLWSKNYNFRKYKSVELEPFENIKMVGQVFGSFTFRLTPVDFCEGICHVLEAKLKEGEFLVFTNFWKLEYINSEDDNSDNIAVISEVHFLT